MKKLFFLHIPKTAGTSFISGFLKKNINAEEYYCFNGIIPTMKSLYNPKIRKKIKIIGGHFKYGIHNFLLTTNYEYITFLRDPINRVISHYYFIKNLNFQTYTHPEYELFNKYSIYDILESSYIGKPLSYTLLDNLQTRYLAGIIPGKHGKVVNDKLYKKALHNLNHINFIGFTEYYEQSIKELSKKLNFNEFELYNYKSSINSKSKNEIPNIDKETLIKYHKYDIQIYNNALKKFNLV